MATTTKCFTPLLGKMIRVTKVDECGNPPAGAATDAFVATDGFISVSLSAEVEDGTEIVTKKADGSLCINEKFSDSFKRLTVETSLCGVNPSLMSFMSNVEPYQGYGATPKNIGFTVPEGELSDYFAFELWTGLAGTSACSGAAGETPGGYLLLPFVTGGVLGDLEVTGEDAIDFSITGASTKGGNAWGVGPFNVLLDDSGGSPAPAPLPTALDPSDHMLMVETSVAPPPSNCSPQDMPA